MLYDAPPPPPPPVRRGGRPGTAGDPGVPGVTPHGLAPERTAPSTVASDRSVVPRMSDNSRVRVSIVGVVVVALFSTLLARLWFLQSGPENSLKVQAVVDSTRMLQTESPRGEIKDRNGEVLVRDRASWAVTVDRDLSKRSRDKVIGQLAELLHVKVGDLTLAIRERPPVAARARDRRARRVATRSPRDPPGPAELSGRARAA